MTLRAHFKHCLSLTVTEIANPTHLQDNHSIKSNLYLLQRKTFTYSDVWNQISFLTHLNEGKLSFAHSKDTVKDSHLKKRKLCSEISHCCPLLQLFHSSRFLYSIAPEITFVRGKEKNPELNAGSRPWTDRTELALHRNLSADASGRPS